MIGNHDTIQWGIIGCGEVTEKKSGPAFNKIPHSRLVAVMRRNSDKAADYALRHGVPRWYHDVEKLITDPEVNAVYIATPPDTHLMYTRMALEAGKPVYVEKPMVLNSREAHEMQQLANQYNDKIVVAHYRRWWPCFQKVKQLLDEGAIGKVHKVHLVCTRQSLKHEDMQRPGVQWRINPAISGGGLFHDLAPHQLDLLLYWFGNATEVHGHSFNHGRIYQADDVTVGSLHFENGVQGFGYWNFSVPAHLQEDYCFMEGEKGWIRCSPFWHTKIECENDEGHHPFEFTPPEHNQIFLIEKTVEFFRGMGENPCPVQDGVITTNWMDILSGGSKVS
jgi:predicted dehydrogenase